MYIQEIDVGILEKKDEGHEPRMQGCVARDAHDKGGRYRFDARRRPRPVEPSFSVSKLCATPPPHFNDLPLTPGVAAIGSHQQLSTRSICWLLVLSPRPRANACARPTAQDGRPHCPR